MNILYVASSVFFFLWAIRNVISQVALWQLKEYRFDRVLIHFRETSQGRSLFFSPLSISKWLLIFSYVFVVFHEEFLLPYYILIFCTYLILSFFVLRENFLNLSRQPVYTVKALSIIVLSLFLLFALYAFPVVDRFLWLLLIDKFSYILVGMIIFGLSFPTEIWRDIQVNRAKKKIRKCKKLLVIGVTGSYGKSSTKEYIGQILEKKFSLLRTKGTNNTPIGIASTILNDLTTRHDVFVVEMGAYKRGEIAGMCDIVHPKIGILTAVNDQHLSLFKNLETTKLAKYELIESLPKNGLALFNGNNAHTEALFEKTKKKKALYTAYYDDQIGDKTSVARSVIYASNIRVRRTSILFDVHMADSLLPGLEAPLIGAHNIENILPAIYIAHTLGMSEKEIKKAVSELKPISKTMIYHALQNGVTLIDDTFNANPDAVIAALDYADIYKGKKILVLQPMIELGRSAKSEHYRVAKAISRICDTLYVTNKNFFSSFRESITDAGGNCVIQVTSPKKIADDIFRTVKRGDIIIFEGKEAAFVLERFLTAKN